MKPAVKQSAQSGFSLVELSIVLVILGLLVGGIMTGQNLIRAAELRSTTTQVDHIRTATFLFRDKYFQTPGDFTKATQFWGSKGGNGSDATCHQTESPDNILTCNGDGDGTIRSVAGDASQGEKFSAIQHLANAGLVEGSYTGTSDSPLFMGVDINENVFRTKMGGYIHFGSWNTGDTTGHAHAFDGYYAQNLVLVTPLASDEMWHIDTKLDDGKPANGLIWTVKSTSSWAPGCTTTDDPDTAEYELSDPKTNCFFYQELK